MKRVEINSERWLSVKDFDGEVWNKGQKAKCFYDSNQR